MRYGILGVLVVVVAVVGWWLWQASPASTGTPGQTKPSTALAPEVENILVTKMAILTSLAAEPALVAAVQSSNQRNASLSMDDIHRLDAQWQAAKSVTPFITQFMTNPTAERLLALQRVQPEFKEVFIADALGLNMAETDKTSDYYQADESWWVDSFAGGSGRTLHGAIEFDESSQTEAISTYVPVKDGAGRAIGVIKGVIDLSAIKKEL